NPAIARCRAFGVRARRRVGARRPGIDRPAGGRLAGGYMRSRRFLFVVIVGVLLVAALVAGHASDPGAPATTPGTPTAPGAAVVAQTSPVWFCPGLPSALPHALGRVTFANI